MVTKLTELEVKEVSLVDIPANKKKVIYKASRTKTELPRCLYSRVNPTDMVSIGNVAKEDEKEDEEEAEEETESKKYCPICGRLLVKGKCPYCEEKTEVKKVAVELEKAKQKIAALEKEAFETKSALLTKEFTERVSKEFSHLPGVSQDQFGAALKNASESMSPNHYTILLKILRSSEALLAQNILTQTIGVKADAQTNGSAASRLHQKALEKINSIQKSGEKLTYEKAYMAAMNENPELYQEYISGKF